jgi:DUF1680 family protein
MTEHSARGEAGCSGHSAMTLDRRRFLAWSAMAAAAGMLGFADTAAALAPTMSRQTLGGRVRLSPSLFHDSVEATHGYLMRLSADRLLHNFREQAGLPATAEVYGGWESDTIAGHTLGHYLSALSLMYAGNDKADCKARADHIVSELRACQLAGSDGYVAGFTRKRADGSIEGGRVVLDEVARGDIRALPFDLNGSWAPFYTWHKLLAGLLDAHRCCGNADALLVLEGIAGYIDGKLAPLDHAQMQRLLDCEFGGMQESLVELGARTGNARWSRLAARFNHDKVVDPLIAGKDQLNRLHANTQIPKLLGAARQFELQATKSDAAAALFFWQRVTGHHSYAIGGNADREYFQGPDTISRYLTEQTCEHCNTLNMIRLSRYLYRWSGEARYYDYIERAQYNHVLSQQHPDGGRFTYMTPMLTGEARKYSEPEGEFWCCVGTGMESHANFSDDIFWQDGDDIIVNLYIPATFEDAQRGIGLRLESQLPAHGQVRLTVSGDRAASLQWLRLRQPQWAGTVAVLRNGTPQVLQARAGYLELPGPWKAGDQVQLEFGMALQVEPCADDATVVALRRGPCVLAADLGPADQPWDGVEPWIAADDMASAFAAAPDDDVFHVRLLSHPQGLRLAPFHSLHERRHAVYFRHLDQAALVRRDRERAAEAENLARVAERRIDHLQLGDDTDEAAHRLTTTGSSYALAYRRQKGRDVRTGGQMSFALRGTRPATVLRLRYWGEEHRRRFSVAVNGVVLANEVLDGGRGDRFIDVDYELPAALHAPTDGGWQVRIEPEPGYSAGPVFGAWLLA